MNLLLAILKLRPLGGKERDFLGLVEQFSHRGHRVTIATTEPPEIALPPDVAVKVMEASVADGRGRHQAFAEAVRKLRSAEPRYDAVVAFERVPSADFLFVAERPRRARAGLRTLLPRHRSLVALEAEAFSSNSSAFAFFLTAEQARSYATQYGINADRMLVLPTTFGVGRSLPAAYYASRTKVRNEFGIPETASVLIQVAVNGHLKGLDRTVDLLARLPETYLLVVGDDRRRIRWRARLRGVRARVRFAGYAVNVPDLIGAADLMVHPAREENTGTVILESLLYGVPAIVSAQCGYAEHVAKACAGAVVAAPFDRHALLTAVRDALRPERLEELKEAARNYGPQLVATGGIGAVANAMLEVISAASERPPRPHDPQELR